MTLLATPLTIFILAGCGESVRLGQFAKQTVELSDVPETVMSAAQKALPDVEFRDAWKNVDRKGDLHSYEIRGRTPTGKIREARVSPTGEILEME